MNPTTVILVATCAVLVGGCRPAERTAPAKSNAPTEVERKTEEFVLWSPTDFREHMAQWAREGWLVHSFNNVTQTDGSALTRAALSRTQSLKAERKPEVERKTLEFVLRSPSDLAEHQTRWARDGWLVHSIVTVTQANGTVLRRAELSRSQSP